MLFKGFEMVDEQGQLLVKCDTGAELVKAHVKGFTRKNGSFVKEHDDSRPTVSHFAYHNGEMMSHYNAAKKATTDDQMHAHLDAAEAHAVAMQAHQFGGDKEGLSTKAKQASEKADKLSRSRVA